MYTYGVLITDKVTGTSKFGLFTGGTALRDCINLVKMNGSGQVKRTGHSYGESRSWDALTFNVCSEPVFVLAENPIRKDNVTVGIVIQVATLHDSFPPGQYGMITGYSRRGAGTVTVQPVRASENAWVGIDATTRVTLPMTWCKDCRGLRSWEV